jgi:hypothetical protein
VADGINNLEDKNYRAEVSLQKMREEGVFRESLRYGEKGSIRIDVLEQTPEGAVCVYDIKTGESGLSPRRIAELGLTVARVYGVPTRLIITETRPFR